VNTRVNLSLILVSRREYRCRGYKVDERGDRCNYEDRKRWRSSRRRIYRSDARIGTCGESSLGRVMKDMMKGVTCFSCPCMSFLAVYIHVRNSSYRVLVRLTAKATANSQHLVNSKVLRCDLGAPRHTMASFRNPKAKFDVVSTIIAYRKFIISVVTSVNLSTLTLILSSFKVTLRWIWQNHYNINQHYVKVSLWWLY
jgi:hypothetical protein